MRIVTWSLVLRPVARALMVRPFSSAVVCGHDVRSQRYGTCTGWDMARKTTLALVGACLLSIGFAQGRTQVTPADTANPYGLRSVAHTAFAPGEKLSYILHYGWLNAGVATVELKENPTPMLGRKVLHASAQGKSMGAFNTFFKVQDLFETRFDQQGVFPWLFNRRCDEGGYIINQDYTYLQTQKKVTTHEKKAFEVPAYTQDMISAFYYARTWDFSALEPGHEFTMNVFIDNEIWPLRMKFVGRETVKVRNGKYRCLKFQPMVQKGRIFKDNDDLNVWVTDDGNRIPVLVQAKILVGSIKMELTDYQGLVNPISKL